MLLFSHLGLSGQNGLGTVDCIYLLVFWTLQVQNWCSGNCGFPETFVPWSWLSQGLSCVWDHILTYPHAMLDGDTA